MYKKGDRGIHMGAEQLQQVSNTVHRKNNISLVTVTEIDKTGYNQAEEIQNFFNTVHKDNDTSYITIAELNKKEYKQYHYLGGASACDRAIELSQQKVNVYHSANAFYMPRRGVATLFHLNALYVDIDCHDKAFDEDKTLYWLKEDFYEKKIPTPTLTVSTGRGLQLYWSIETAPVQVLPLWSLVQQKIIDELAEINEYVDGVSVDRKCVDPTRILRVPYTYNQKSNTQATITDELDYCYTMSEIVENYFPQLQIVKKNPNPNKNTKVFKEYSNIYRIYNIQTLLFARVEDFKTLVGLRGDGINGKRDTILYMFAWSVISKNATEDDVFNELDSFNSLFVTPLSDSEIKYKAKHIYNKYKTKVLKKANPTKKYEYYDRYIFKNETIINTLEITLEEQRYMKTIISKEEKYRRNNEKRTPRNEKGLTKRQQEKENTKAKVQELKLQGLSRSQVVELTGFSESTVKRYWK